MWDTVFQQWTRANDRQYDMSCSACASTLTFHLNMSEQNLTQIVALTDVKLEVGIISPLPVYINGD